MEVGCCKGDHSGASCFAQGDPALCVSLPTRGGKNVTHCSDKCGCWYSAATRLAPGALGQAPDDPEARPREQHRTKEAS